MASDLSDEILERALTGRFGRYRRVYDSIDSTNLEALRWAAEEGAAEGSLVVSDEQTAGRGRWGRSWVAAPGSSLLFSVVLRPTDSIEPGLLTTVAGLAVADGIQSASGLSTLLKWPNDVLVAGRKVAGILVEARSGASAGDDPGDAVVMGAGINLHWRRNEIPADLGESATSIAAEVGRGRGEAGWARPDRRAARVPARAELLGAVIEELENLYGSLPAQGTDEVVEAAAGRSAVIGERVTIRFADGTESEGLARGIAPNGGLILDDDRIITAGEIEQLRPKS
jgi:BirA family transcriptional regulator, biotin operon repressor / biotin---[acetyl-CoA-carboxylase] ligase